MKGPNDCDCGVVRFILAIESDALDAARAGEGLRDWEPLLERIRRETREAVIEGDATDCSSPDCIADAVYEIVRVALSVATESDALDAARTGEGLREALDTLEALAFPIECRSDAARYVTIEQVRAALHPDTAATEPTYRLVERLDRPGNRANGTRSTRP